MFLIVNNNLNFDADCIRDALKKVDKSCQIKIMGSNCTVSLAELHKFKGIILSGGPWDITQPMLFSSFKLNVQVMLNAAVPIYGICMGHQIMADANGADIGRWPNMYQGYREIKILDHSALFQGLPDKISVFEWHQEVVLAAPPGFNLTAFSDSDHPFPPPVCIADDSQMKNCMVQALHNKDKKMYSTQFHPEFSGEVGLTILNNFINLCEK